MPQFQVILKEIWALFVDDSWFAVAIVIWVALTNLALLELAPVGASLFLFVGLAAILIVGAVWRARK